MKRHAALHPLSHDHQNALARALRLRRVRNADRDARDAERRSFREFASTRLAPHFTDEERLLAEAVAQRPDDAELADALARVRAEHANLRARFAELGDEEPGAADADGDWLHDIGAQLTDHVRYEERELFELLQQRFVGPDLDALVAASEAPARS